MIDGVQVSLDTDHRNLQFVVNIKHSSGQLARWAMRLSEFNYKLAYRPGNQMPVADCLSRNPRDVTLTEEEAMCLALQMCESQDFDDDPACVEDNTGHIASAFMMVSELHTDNESEFMVTVCTEAEREGVKPASCQPAATRCHRRSNHQRRNNRGTRPMPALYSSPD